MDLAFLPTELQLIIAEFYFKCSDTTTATFYDKWCLAKHFNRHFGTKHLRKVLVESTIHIHEPRHITTGNPRMTVSLPFPGRRDAPCIDNRQNFLNIMKLYKYEDPRDIYVSFSSRWLPCLGCQHNQECTNIPFEITTMWTEIICFAEELEIKEGFNMSISAEHPFPIEYHDPLGDTEDATKEEFSSVIIPRYHPDLGPLPFFAPDELNISPEDVKDMIKRNELDNLLV